MSPYSCRATCSVPRIFQDIVVLLQPLHAHGLTLYMKIYEFTRLLRFGPALPSASCPLLLLKTFSIVSNISTQVITKVALALQADPQSLAHANYSATSK